MQWLFAMSWPASLTLPRGDVTLQHLMTHTAGGQWAFPRAKKRWPCHLFLYMDKVLAIWPR